MSRSAAITFLKDASQDERLLTRSSVREERRSCLMCGPRIGSDDPMIHVRGTLIHMRCAVYRRRRLCR